MYSTLVSVEQLNSMIGIKDLVVVDCRYDLANPAQGRQDYLDSHIPGAVFADVHDDLSSTPNTDSGRHPLPSPENLNKLFSRLGISHGSQVIVYDAIGGAFAARLWWLLRYMGHEAVALLDGGWTEWCRQSSKTDKEIPEIIATNYNGTAMSGWLRLVDQVPKAKLLIDSRDPARYRGENEPIDPAAGHIPGAINYFWQNNLGDDGLFKSPDELRNQFDCLFDGKQSNEAVFYCGSGVTACHNLLAVCLAGLEPANLYAGSWSEWCSDPVRPVAVGND